MNFERIREVNSKEMLLFRLIWEESDSKLEVYDYIKEFIELYRTLSREVYIRIQHENLQGMLSISMFLVGKDNWQQLNLDLEPITNQILMLHNLTDLSEVSNKIAQYYGTKSN